MHSYLEQLLSSAEGLTTLGVLAIVTLLLRYIYKSRWRSLTLIRGPSSPSWLVGMSYPIVNPIIAANDKLSWSLTCFPLSAGLTTVKINAITKGNEFDIVHQLEVNKLQDPWFREYGSVFRYTGCFGENILCVADPKTLQHIFHTSGYHYPKTNDFRNDIRRLFGKGIVWAEGSTHQRHRKVLNPAFSASQLRTFLSVFQKSTQRLVIKWQDQYPLLDQNKEKGQVIDVTKWISRLTLDVIGETSFDYDFQALDGEYNHLSKVMQELFQGNIERSKMALLFRALRRNFTVDPTLHNPFNPKKPLILTSEDQQHDNWLKVSQDTAKEILRKKAESGNQGIEDGSKDILSILVRSNAREDPKKRLDDEEVLSQMSTMILAGHETTASTTVWLLYELAKHPEQQRRILEEIREVRRRKMDASENEQFTPNDYDSMSFFNASIKEVLRLYPIAIDLFRSPDRDDVIPLSEPIISTSGHRLTEVPIQKGQRLHIDIYTYNRLKSVWGEDADTWNPERFLDEKKAAVSLGVFANLMTFSAGVRACIGWRFALLELEAILEGLICAFEFSLDPSLKILKAQAGVLAPLVIGREREGLQMPLTVKHRISTYT
ncbi:hypothetical protein VKT23_017532 [Stygiomarasmius scandens]|uniref:Cytochrome P450 n=1 Tax=Marasmiellus scandens TaxID=2682957 RepID=A0ABR1IRF5_9AGAR